MLGVHLLILPLPRTISLSVWQHSVLGICKCKHRFVWGSSLQSLFTVSFGRVFVSCKCFFLSFFFLPFHEHWVIFPPADFTPKHSEETSTSRCLLPQERGHCRDYSIMYYYDAAAGDCGRFWYGGCHGNMNRFETYVECMESCAMEEVAVVTGRWCKSILIWHHMNSYNAAARYSYFMWLGTMQHC